MITMADDMFYPTNQPSPAMIDAAVIGLGRWGKSIVEAVAGKSRRLRFIRGVSKEPGLVAEFAKTHGFELSTEFSDAVADPRGQAVFLATPHPLHVAQTSAAAPACNPGGAAHRRPRHR